MLVVTVTHFKTETITKRCTHCTSFSLSLCLYVCLPLCVTAPVLLSVALSLIPCTCTFLAQLVRRRNAITWSNHRCRCRFRCCTFHFRCTVTDRCWQRPVPGVPQPATEATLRPYRFLRRKTPAHGHTESGNRPG